MKRAGRKVGGQVASATAWRGIEKSSWRQASSSGGIVKIYEDKAKIWRKWRKENEKAKHQIKIKERKRK